MTNMSGQGARREGWLPFQRAAWFEMEVISTSYGFDQNGHLPRQSGLKYRHIPEPSFLAPGRFASNLDGVVYAFTA
ncbi:hypothetical protein NOLU111490_09895 [Novosphingobium lubricantis]|jgi:hypothetical protein